MNTSPYCQFLRKQLHDASLPHQFFSYVWHHIIYLIDRLRTFQLDNHSVFQILLGNSPHYNPLCFFWLFMLSIAQTILQKKTFKKIHPCVYLGFFVSYHCHLCLTLLLWRCIYPEIYDLLRVVFHLKLKSPIFSLNHVICNGKIQ